MMSGIEGRTALVTGAASGIGAACAVHLGRAGAQVVVADIDLEGAHRVAAGIPGARAQALDVADEAAWEGAIAQIERREGALHFLVNNAAICIAARLLSMSFASWKRQNAINLDSVFLGTRAAIPLIERSGGGSIVNISSVAGQKGLAGLSGYCASKAGVRIFTKAAALECAQARNGIRVNSIHPGAIETPIWVKMGNDGVMPEAGDNAIAEAMAAARAASEAATPMGLAGTPDDIAAGVGYLCSDAARFVTGAELVIDGGALCA